MTNQPKPAPTAEEQLPQLDEECLSAIEKKGWPSTSALLKCRERQLAAALRSLREKEAQLAEWEKEIAQLNEPKLESINLEKNPKTGNMGICFDL